MASVTRTKLRNAIAEALWDSVSATQLADVCDDLRMPPAPADVHPMSSKRQYVQSRTKRYEMAQLVATAREVVLDYPHQDLVALLAEIDGTAGGVRGELKNVCRSSTPHGVRCWCAQWVPERARHQVRVECELAPRPASSGAERPAGLVVGSASPQHRPPSPAVITPAVRTAEYFVRCEP